MRSPTTIAAIAALQIAILFSSASAHTYWTEPRQRGLLKRAPIKLPVFDPTAPIDYSPHFPCGAKCLTPGCGLRSQKKAAGPAGWTLFEPLKPGFVWRAGVCGDLKWENHHLRGGKFYHGGKIVEEYNQGGVISVDMAVVAHHNGYMELHLCDVKKCGGEISEKCFQQGHCQQLKRVVDPSCESKNDKLCAPIDPNYPGRFYMPCSENKKPDRYGFGKIKYQLPKNLACEHCVLHFYAAAANACNPPGVTAFFEGPRGPNWGECPGQGGAKGGYRRWPALCGGDKFSEEYYQCADIKINGNGQPTEPSRSPTRTPSPSPSPAPITAPRVEDPSPSPSPSKRPYAPPPPPAQRPSPSPSPSKRPYAPPPPPAQRPSPSPSTSKKPTTSSSSYCQNDVQGGNPLRKFVLITDNGKRDEWCIGDKTWEIDANSFKKVTFEVVTWRNVKSVPFYINGHRSWRERVAPYVFRGDYNWGYAFWNWVIWNREFTLKVMAEGEGHVMEARVILRKSRNW